MNEDLNLEIVVLQSLLLKEESDPQAIGLLADVKNYFHKKYKNLLCSVIYYNNGSWSTEVA